MTGSLVASWYPEAVFDRTVAATHVKRDASLSSARTSVLSGVLPFKRPPGPPPAAPPPIGPRPVTPKPPPPPPPPRPGGPPAPNGRLAPAGPADGMAPECAVLAVATEYAPGPTRPITAAVTATATARRPRNQCPASTKAAAPNPPTSASQRSPWFQSGVRSSSVYDPSAVAANATARAPRASTSPRRRHNIAAPIPTMAPTGGARATA